MGYLHHVYRGLRFLENKMDKTRVKFVIILSMQLLTDVIYLKEKNTSNLLHVFRKKSRFNFTMGKVKRTGHRWVIHCTGGWSGLLEYDTPILL